MVFVKHNSLMSGIFFNPIFIPGFAGSRFFRVQVLSESRFFRVQVLEVAISLSSNENNMRKDFILKRLLLFEICAREICEKFVYKYSKKIEYVKNQPTFYEIYKLHGHITSGFLGIGKQKFQGIVFIGTQTYREIFKSVLVYL